MHRLQGDRDQLTADEASLMESLCWKVVMQAPLAMMHGSGRRITKYTGNERLNMCGGWISPPKLSGV